MSLGLVYDVCYWSSDFLIFMYIIKYLNAVFKIFPCFITLQDDSVLFTSIYFTVFKFSFEEEEKQLFLCLHLRDLTAIDFMSSFKVGLTLLFSAS